MDLKQLQEWAKQQREFEKDILHQQAIDRNIQYILIAIVSIAIMAALATIIYWKLLFTLI
jgi:hypothetical protein